MNIFEQAEKLRKQFDEEEKNWRNRGWFKLYRYEYTQGAYKDQFGKGHWADVLTDIVEVKVVDTYLTSDYGLDMLGFVAKDKEGNEYKYLPSAEGNGFWDGSGKNWKHYLDGLTVDREGNQVLPEPRRRVKDEQAGLRC